MKGGYQIITVEDSLKLAAAVEAAQIAEDHIAPADGLYAKFATDKALLAANIITNDSVDTLVYEVLDASKRFYKTADGSLIIRTDEGYSIILRPDDVVEYITAASEDDGE